MHDFCVRNRVSIWLCFVSFSVTATMMHPNFASLVALAINGLLLGSIRTVAHIEGRSAQ